MNEYKCKFRVGVKQYGWLFDYTKELSSVEYIKAESAKEAEVELRKMFKEKVKPEVPCAELTYIDITKL